MQCQCVFVSAAYMRNVSRSFLSHIPVLTCTRCDMARLRTGSEEGPASRNRKQEGGKGRAKNKGDGKESHTFGSSFSYVLSFDLVFSVGLRMVCVGNVGSTGVVGRSASRE